MLSVSVRVYEGCRMLPLINRIRKVVVMSTKRQKGARIKGIDGVILIANDFEGQCRFYRDVLGLELVAHYGDAAFFKAGSQTLGIFAKSHHSEGTRRLGQADHGISHLEFSTDAEAEEKLTQRLMEAGAHAYKDNFADADGNLFHFTRTTDGQS
jgi:catechol 2,3-dioxygenase-like lactoylglutathione lyase family enzyme